MRDDQLLLLAKELNRQSKYSHQPNQLWRTVVPWIAPLAGTGLLAQV